MNEEIMKNFNESLDIVAKIATMSDYHALSTLCMIVDQVTKMVNMKSVDLLDDIRPIIAEVNAAMGDKGVL